jgi:hypothetical protein
MRRGHLRRLGSRAVAWGPPLAAGGASRVVLTRPIPLPVPMPFIRLLLHVRCCPFAFITFRSCSSPDGDLAPVPAHVARHPRNGRARFTMGPCAWAYPRAPALPSAGQGRTATSPPAPVAVAFPSLFPTHTRDGVTLCSVSPAPTPSHASPSPTAPASARPQLVASGVACSVVSVGV